jgi:hypothetical protein
VRSSAIALEGEHRASSKDAVVEALAMISMGLMETSQLGRGVPWETGADVRQTKGSHVIQARDWIDAKLGPRTFQSLVEGKGAIDNPILLPGTWYDVLPLVEALEVVGKEVNRSVQDLTMEIARQNALRDLTTIYRVFLRIAAPVRVMSYTPRLWGNYVAFGQATAIKNEPTHYIGECKGVPTRLLDWASGAWCGFVPAAIEVAGGKGAVGRITGVWKEAGGMQRLQCEVRYRMA